MVQLSPLQQEFLEVLETGGDIEPFGVERDALIADIKHLNAIELRQNIKAFKDAT